jgi:hypothetical protein
MRWRSGLPAEGNNTPTAIHLLYFRCNVTVEQPEIILSLPETFVCKQSETHTLAG